MPHHEEMIDVYAVEGQFQHLIYSPRGGYEGLLIDTYGIPTQFVFDKHDETAADAFAHLQPGQSVTVEGSLRQPSDKGEGNHVVYDFHRLSHVAGKPVESAHTEGPVRGRVVRINHAKHGVPNGVVLDSGDFVHLKPEGFEQAGLEVGDEVEADGPSRPLAGGQGRVMEARTVNGHALAPR